MIIKKVLFILLIYIGFCAITMAQNSELSYFDQLHYCGTEDIQTETLSESLLTSGGSTSNVVVGEVPCQNGNECYIKYIDVTVVFPDYFPNSGDQLTNFTATGNHSNNLPADYTGEDFAREYIEGMNNLISKNQTDNICSGWMYYNNPNLVPENPRNPWNEEIYDKNKVAAGTLLPVGIRLRLEDIKFISFDKPKEAYKSYDYSDDNFTIFVLGKDYFPSSGFADIPSRKFVVDDLGNKRGNYSLGMHTLALHELGHALGLYHNFYEVYCKNSNGCSLSSINNSNIFNNFDTDGCPIFNENAIENQNLGFSRKPSSNSRSQENASGLYYNNDYNFTKDFIGPFEWLRTTCDDPREISSNAMNYATCASSFTSEQISEMHETLDNYNKDTRTYYRDLIDDNLNAIPFFNVSSDIPICNGTDINRTISISGEAGDQFEWYKLNENDDQWDLLSYSQTYNITSSGLYKAALIRDTAKGIVGVDVFRVGKISNVPYYEDFNDHDLCGMYNDNRFLLDQAISNGSCTLEGLWQNVRSDNFDWGITYGSPKNNYYTSAFSIKGTDLQLFGYGPRGDVDEYQKFIQLETSLPDSLNVNSIGYTADLISPCFDLSSPCTYTLEFYAYLDNNNYSNNTSHNQALDVLVSNNGGATWNSVLSITQSTTGNQFASPLTEYAGTNWEKFNVSLNANQLGPNTQFKFMGTFGKVSREGKDIGIDNFKIYNDYLAVSKSQIAVCPGDMTTLSVENPNNSLNYTWTNDRDPNWTSTGSSITVTPYYDTNVPQTQTIYTVTATDGSCNYKTEIAVTVTDNGSKVFGDIYSITVPDDFSVCRYESFSLNASSNIPNATYEWSVERVESSYGGIYGTDYIIYDWMDNGSIVEFPGELLNNIIPPIKIVVKLKVSSTDFSCNYFKYVNIIVDDNDFINPNNINLFARVASGSAFFGINNNNIITIDPCFLLNNNTVSLTWSKCFTSNEFNQNNIQAINWYYNNVLIDSNNTIFEKSNTCTQNQSGVGSIYSSTPISEEGEYAMEVYFDNGCSIKKSVNINISGLNGLDFFNINSNCIVSNDLQIEMNSNADNLQSYAWITPNGGTYSDVYLNANNNTLTLNSNDSDYIGTWIFSYTVNGCTNEIEIYIDPLNKSCEKDLTVCNTSPLVLESSFDLNDPNLNISASYWDKDGNTIQVNDILMPLMYGDSQNHAGSYTFHAFYTTGCVATETINVSVENAPTLDFVNQELTICSNDANSANLEAFSNSSNIQWTVLSAPNGSNPSFSLPNSATTVVNGLTIQGNYMFECTASNTNCSNSKIVTINVIDSFNFEIGSESLDICSGQQTQINISMLINDGNIDPNLITLSGWTVNGSGSPTINPNSSSATISNIFQAGTYTVSVTGTYGSCSHTSSVNFEVHNPPTPTISEIQFQNNDGCMYGLTTNQNYASYEWWRIEGSGHILVGTENEFTPDGSGSGTYYVIVTDAYGCSGQSPNFTSTYSGVNRNTYTDDKIESLLAYGTAQLDGETMRIIGMVNVRSGQKLSIRFSDVEFFDENSGILVETGGHLEVLNSSLHGNSCDSFNGSGYWSGIQVMGDYQNGDPEGSYLNHPDFGYAYLYDTDVEKAIIGLNVFSEILEQPGTNLPNSNGFISINACTFKNNLTGIYMGPTTSSQRSVIKNSRFENNGIKPSIIQTLETIPDFTGIILDRASTAYDNASIMKINECEFVSTASILSGLNGTGIRVINTPVWIGVINTPGNIFTNLYRGVDVYSVPGLNNTVNIYKNNFNGVLKGVTMNSTAYSDIQQNTFVNIPGGGQPGSSEDAYGVLMFHSFGYDITDNIFRRSNATDSNQARGIILTNTFFDAQAGVGTNGSTVNNNIFEGVFHSATEIEGNNRAVSFNCNEYTRENFADWRFVRETGSNISDAELDAQGDFLGTDQNLLLRNLWHNTETNIDGYHIVMENYNPSATLELNMDLETGNRLTKIENNIGASLAFNNLNQNSTACGAIPSSDPPSGDCGLNGGVSTCKTSTSKIKFCLSLGRLEIVEENLRCPYVYDDHVAEYEVLGFKSWAMKVLVGTSITKAEYDKARMQLDSIPQTTEENIEFVEVYNALIDGLENGTTAGKNSSFEILLKDMAGKPKPKKRKGQNGTLSETALAILHGKSYVRSAVGAGKTQTSTIDDTTVGLEFNLMPNPSNGFVQLSFNKLVTGKVEVFSLEGKLLQTRQINQQNKLSLILDKLNMGIYFVKFKDERSFEQCKKLIINQ